MESDQRFANPCAVAPCRQPLLGVVNLILHQVVETRWQFHEPIPHHDGQTASRGKSQTARRQSQASEASDSRSAVESYEK